jgi:hypothetical protein
LIGRDVKKSAMAIIVIILALIVGILSNKTAYSQTAPYACHLDSDCVMASRQLDNEKCCADCGSEAIHKKEQADRIQWSISHCSESKKKDCPIYDCMPSQQTVLACVKNRCEAVVPKSFEECRNESDCLLGFVSKTGDINLCKKIRETLGSCSKEIWSVRDKKEVPY